LKNREIWQWREKGTEIIGELVGFNRQFLPKLPSSLPIRAKPVV
jgi:hypothetical protein